MFTWFVSGNAKRFIYIPDEVIVTVTLARFIDVFKNGLTNLNMSFF